MLSSKLACGWLASCCGCCFQGESPLPLAGANGGGHFISLARLAPYLCDCDCAPSWDIFSSLHCWLIVFPAREIPVQWTAKRQREIEEERKKEKTGSRLARRIRLAFFRASTRSSTSQTVGQTHIHGNCACGVRASLPLPLPAHGTSGLHSSTMRTVQR